MSYARFGVGSDVYVFLNTEGYIDCCGCLLQDKFFVKDENLLLGGYVELIEPIIQTTFKTVEAALEHLSIHKERGHLVPESCVQQLSDPEEVRYIQNYIEEQNGKPNTKS